MKSRDVHVFGFGGGIQQLQDANTLSDSVGADPPGISRAMQLRKPLVPDATDHSSSVN
jgi:hypothetical protein